MSAAGPAPVAAPAASALPPRPRQVVPTPLAVVAATVGAAPLGARPDARPDAGLDAVDAGFDAGLGARPDAGFDARLEAGLGARPDAVSTPASTPVSTRPDAGFDARLDAGLDARPDARPGARPDARLDPPLGSTGRSGDTLVTGVTLRAAEVRPGDLFAALPGARTHGADFAAEAIARGAVAVLTDPVGATRPALHGLPVLVHAHPRDVLGAVAALVYGDPTARLSVLGVTGTSGKTTVAHLLEAGLAAAGRTVGLLGTVGIRIDGAPLPSAFTTPEAPDLQALFAAMLEAGVTDAAMEVSSHALALGRVAGTRFAVGAFTNLSQDHLDFHRDMDDYFAAKATLFDGRAEQAVVCVDDEWGAKLAARTPDAVTVASTGPADWCAADTVTDADGGQRFTALTPHGPVPVRLRCPGRSTWPTRWSRSRAWPRSAWNPVSPRSVSPESPCRVGCSGSRWASRSSPWSTTRTSPPPSPRCWTPCVPRCPGG